MPDRDPGQPPLPPHPAPPLATDRLRTAADADGPFAYRGRWALVTGASMGIGEAFAWALAERGMNLVLCARSEDRLQQLARAIRAEHRVQTHVVPADLAQPRAPADAWRRTGEGRDIHLLVNNAGFGLHGRFEALPADRQAEMVALNCTAVLELAHLALGGMRTRGTGGIINVASVVAFQPVPWMATYAATKAFVLSLSQSLAEENRGSGVRVLCVSPGSTPSGFQATAGTRLRDDQPGLLQPREVVDAALHALDAGRAHVAPGLANRVATVLGRLLPLGTVTRIARRLNENR
jgi:short-subunit dehydrogenase